MTRDIGLGPAQLLVILAMSLVLVIVMRWVVRIALKCYGNLNTSLNEGLMREMIEFYFFSIVDHYWRFL